jgi:hypothetical protein
MINNQITQMGCGGVIGPSKPKGTSSLMEGKFWRTMLPLLWFKCPPSSKRLNNKQFNHVCSIDFISFFSFAHIWKQPNLSSYANTSKCSHEYNLHMWCMWVMWTVQFMSQRIKRWGFQIPFICFDPMEKHRAYEVSYLYIFEFMTFLVFNDW